MANETTRIACRRHDWTEALFDGTIAEPSMEFTEGAHCGTTNCSPRCKGCARLAVQLVSRTAIELF